jgi:hypothetical protein
MAITFTPEGQSSVSVTPIPGTLQFGGGHDDRGGGDIPNMRAGTACNGNCEVLIDSSAFTIAQALALRSGTGEGDVDISGEATSYSALVDVEITGDSVQIARISWKGTISASS